jgi:hypothetical protein
VWNSCVGWWGGIAYGVLGQGVPTIRKGKEMNTDMFAAIEAQYHNEVLEVRVTDTIYDQVTLTFSQAGDTVNINLSLEQIEQVFGKINNYLQEREDKKAHAEAVALAQFDAMRDDQAESISLA